MKKSIDLFFGSDSSGRDAAPRSGYRPLDGFPRSLRILVADDDKDTVTTLKAILDDEGHDVMGAYSGSEVLSAIRTFRPEVLILDIAMPDVNGFALAKRIREQFSVYPLLIAISGIYKTDDDRVASEVFGFDHHLVKPCDPVELLALIAPLANPNGDR